MNKVIRGAWIYIDNELIDLNEVKEIYLSDNIMNFIYKNEETPYIVSFNSIEEASFNYNEVIEFINPFKPKKFLIKKDVDLSIWSGIIPISTHYDTPISTDTTPLPNSVKQLLKS